MAASNRYRVAALLMACSLAMLVGTRRFSAFTAPVPHPHQQLQQQRLRGGAPTANQGLQEGTTSPSSAFNCFAAAVGLAVAGCGRVVKVLMRGGQGGRNNFGQSYMPKGGPTKRKVINTRRKTPGTSQTMYRPRRYVLYDLLEEADEIRPAFTVVSEPEEPLEPVEDVPLLERYPWAGSLEKVSPEVQERESGEDKREVYFGSFQRRVLPPKGRKQTYFHRVGWHLSPQPPWLNRLEGIEIPGDLEWKRDRRPKSWQLQGAEKLEALKRERALAKTEDEEPEDIDEAEDDDE